MCVRKTARVFFVNFFTTCFVSMPSVRGSMSTNTGLKPFWTTEAMSEIQVRVGTMISPGPNRSRMAAMVTWLADEPELTNTLCLTPSHCDHSSSNAATFFDCVRIGSSCCRNLMTASRSWRAMLFSINGQLRSSAAAGDILLFVVVIAIFNNDRTASVVTHQRFFVRGKNLFGFVEADDLDRLAHQPECLGEIADVLVLRVQRAFGTDAGADDDLGPVTGDDRQLVEVIDNLVDGEQQKIPARIDADRDHPVQRHAGGHTHLHLFGHGQFEQFFGINVLKRIAH